MPWVVITEQGLEVPEPSGVWTRSQAVQALLGPEMVASGWVWDQFVEGLERHHQRLLLNFRAGWGAVSWTVASPQPEVQSLLGSFAPPSEPGPRLEAPFGCYLLGRRRSQKGLLQLGEEARSPERWGSGQHRLQARLGPVFLDPRIELKLPELREVEVNVLVHREASLAERLWSGLSLLFGGGERD